MVKNKKPKLSKIDKLRHILDNPNDPNIKDLISKDDENLETVRSKLSGKTTQSKAQIQPLESLTEQADTFEKKIDVDEKKDEVSKAKQVEVDRKDIDGEDLIEVEKEVVKKTEFIEIKPEELKKETESIKKLEKEEKDDLAFVESKQIEEKSEPKISPKKISIEEHPVKDEKVKIIDFRNADKDEVYWKTKKGLLSSDKIKIYKPIQIFEMWAFTIILFIVAISGLFLLRDWLFLNLINSFINILGLWEIKFLNAASNNSHLIGITFPKLTLSSE